MVMTLVCVFFSLQLCGLILSIQICSFFLVSLPYFFKAASSSLIIFKAEQKFHELTAEFVHAVSIFGRVTSEQ